MQVDKLEGSVAYTGLQSFKVDLEKRATSMALTEWIREICSDGKMHEAAEIREYIDSRQEKGEFYTQGQLAGCLKNMVRRGELTKAGWGNYRAESNLGLKLKAAAPSPAVSSKKMYGADSEPTPAVIVSQIKASWEIIRAQMDGFKLSQLSDREFQFIAEFRKMDESIQDFCMRYEDD